MMIPLNCANKVVRFAIKFSETKVKLISKYILNCNMMLQLTKSSLKKARKNLKSNLKIQMKTKKLRKNKKRKIHKMTSFFLPKNN